MRRVGIALVLSACVLVAWATVIEGVGTVLTPSFLFTYPLAGALFYFLLKEYNY